MLYLGTASEQEYPCTTEEKMTNGQYVVLYTAMDETKGVHYTLDDRDGKTLSFHTIEEAESEFKRQVDDDELEVREVIIAEVVKRGGTTTSFLWS
jgi:hypothetical protein